MCARTHTHVRTHIMMPLAVVKRMGEAGRKCTAEQMISLDGGGGGDGGNIRTVSLNKVARELSCRT